MKHGRRTKIGSEPIKATPECFRLCSSRVPRAFQPLRARQTATPISARTADAHGRWAWAWRGHAGGSPWLGHLPIFCAFKKIKLDKARRGRQLRLGVEALCTLRRLLCRAGIVPLFVLWGPRAKPHVPSVIRLLRLLSGHQTKKTTPKKHRKIRASTAPRSLTYLPRLTKNLPSSDLFLSGRSFTHSKTEENAALLRTISSTSDFGRQISTAALLLQL